MKGTIKINDSKHVFKKTNLVTNKDNSDSYECSKWGIKGKRFGFTEELLISNCKKDLFYNCDGREQSDFVSKQVMIGCNIGFEFEDLSVRSTVECPKEYENKYGNCA